MTSRREILATTCAVLALLPGPGAAAAAQPLAQASQPARSSVAPATTIEQIGALLSRNDVAAAGTAVDTALRSHPDDPALHNFAGVIAAQQGAFEAAESHFQAAIRFAPRAAPPYENLGRLYQERARHDPAGTAKALDTYRRLLAVDPDNIEGLYQSAFLRALSGEFAASRALVERLPERVRRRPQALAVLTADLAGLRDSAAAAVAEELSGHADVTAADVIAVLPAFRHVKDDDVQTRLLEGLDRRGLASADVLQHLGAIYVRHGQFTRAREVLERAASSGATVPILVDLGRVAAKLSDYKGALGYLAHARSLEPRNATVHFLFGIVCVQLNLAREAYESLKKAVELDPENPSINYAMGAVATHRHEPSESLPYFETYVRLKPDDPRGRFALGAARFYSNQLDEARRDLEQASRSPETATGAHYFLGRIARQSNDLVTARRELDQVLQANPDFADAWAELGLLQTRAGEYADAEQSLARALAIDPENYAATVNLATLYSRTKDPRRDAQQAHLTALLEKRAERAQEFLRIIEVVP